MAELTAKQRRFALEYLVDLNATQAAIRAGYSVKTARAIASENLTKPAIRALVDEALKRREQRTEVTAARVLQEMARIALADMGQAFDASGNLLPIHEMPEDVRRALSGFEAEELFEGSGAERTRMGNVRKVKFWDKPRVLEMLGKHLRMFEDDPKASVTGQRVTVVVRGRDEFGEVVEDDGSEEADRRPERLPADEDAGEVPAVEG